MPEWCLDADPSNADWTKQSWDLPIDNVEDLREYLRETEQTVEEFKQLPIYTMNVDKLPWLNDL